MILYFSGTGNSEYVAKRISKELTDECINLFEKIRENDFSTMHSQCPWVVVVPTYAWRIPHIVRKWIENTLFTGNKNIYFILTCGGSIGNAGKYLVKTCKRKNMNYCGCIGIIMPENYIALFSTPTQEKAMQIIEQAEPVINQAIHYIKNGNPLPQIRISIKDNMNSGIVNGLFIRYLFMPKNFLLLAIAFLVANALICVRLTIFRLKMDCQSGEIHVHTVWLVSVIVPKRRLNTENIAKA